VTFKAALAGTNGVFLLVGDQGGLSTGWQQRGIWTVR
jgi:hypothetical protein